MYKFTNGVKWIELESCAKKINESSYYDILDYFRNKNII